MELTEKIKEKIKEHTLSDIENESCGLIIEDGTVIPCENRAEDSKVHFIIAAGDIKKAQKQGWIEAVYHSHVFQNEKEDGLSDEDIVIAEYFNVHSVVYSVKDDKFYEYFPTGKPIEYIGRPYIRGVLDEFHLIRDYYKKELNIEIADLKNKNIEIFLQNNGFCEVDAAKKHDILVLKWSGDTTKKKMALYLSDDKILVHPEFEMSKFVNYNYGLKRWTEKIYRHNKL